MFNLNQSPLTDWVRKIERALQAKLEESLAKNWSEAVGTTGVIAGDIPDEELVFTFVKPADVQIKISSKPAAYGRRWILLEWKRNLI